MSLATTVAYDRPQALLMTPDVISGKKYLLLLTKQVQLVREQKIVCHAGSRMGHLLTIHKVVQVHGNTQKSLWNRQIKQK